MKTWENPSQEAINENDLAPLPWISSIHHYLYRKLFQSRTFHFQSNRVMYILLKIIVNVYIKNHILVAQCIEFLFFFSIFFFISRYKLVNDIREQISSIRRWALLLQLVLWGMASNRSFSWTFFCHGRRVFLVTTESYRRVQPSKLWWLYIYHSLTIDNYACKI